jgi:two-component system LytT family response regulator
LRVLIVDDEPLARHQLARLCEQHGDLDVVAQAASGAAAIEAVRAHQPDLMLLDVELNDMSGFDVLRSFTDSRAPLAIIVAPCPERALEAFESNAIDYLTKPVDTSRFGTAIDRARQRHSRAAVTEQPAAGGAGTASKLLGEKARRLYFIDVHAVEYIESDLNYVSIHTADCSYLSRNTMKHLTAALAQFGFVRIHRSLLLNLRRVAFAERIGHGTLAFTLAGGRRLESGPAYRKVILQHLRNRPARPTSENG